jgi:hypothetical protein
MVNSINKYLRRNPVSCKYGAPLGASNIQGDNSEKLHLQCVRLDSGGYDPGGTYWGRGQSLYCAFGDDGTESYYRAWSRDEAKEKVLSERPNARFFR